jgi:hypothetical protein
MTLATGFIERLGEQAIDTIVTSLAAAPPYFWITAEHYLHGEIWRATPDLAAFPLRRPGYTIRIFAALQEPSEIEALVPWVEGLRAALEPFSGDALYVNYLTEDAGQRA